MQRPYRMELGVRKMEDAKLSQLCLLIGLEDIARMDGRLDLHNEDDFYPGLMGATIDDFADIVAVAAAEWRCNGNATGGTTDARTARCNQTVPALDPAADARRREQVDYRSTLRVETRRARRGTDSGGTLR